MLNPDLKLNQKIFDENVEQRATRDGFGDALVELGDKNPNVVVLTADLSESTRVEAFAKKYPERFFEVGVAEQNMAAIAAGLSVSGKTSFITSYAAFSPGKNLETIRTTIAYNNADVKIAGHHAGIMTGADGATHQATEDLAIMRSMPNMTIFVPCDAIEAKKATLEATKTKSPTYLRFSRDKTPIITTGDTPFYADKVQPFWISKNPKATIFATGYMLYYSLLAAKNLENKGIETIVINSATIKPSDTNSITEYSKKTGKVVTVEDHQIMGGLGGMIAETLAKYAPMPIELVGLNDIFAQSGTPKELLNKYKMDEKSIAEAVDSVIKR